MCVMKDYDSKLFGWFIDDSCLWFLTYLHHFFLAPSSSFRGQLIMVVVPFKWLVHIQALSLLHEIGLGKIHQKQKDWTWKDYVLLVSEIYSPLMH